MERMKKTTEEKMNGKNGMMSSKLHHFFIDELKDIYWAEKLLVKTLPEMKEAATHKELQKAFADHLEQTKTHVKRIEKVFGSIGAKPEAKKCEAMEGLTREAEEIIENTEKGTCTRDVGLIVAAQKVEHYEIATYGSLVQLARTMGHTEAEGLLQATLEEEKAADHNLTEIAESKVNEMSLEEQEA